jgi:arginine-tRNA-protein transferase
MTDQSAHFPKFYVTTPSPCPYIDGNIERKIFTDLKIEPPTYDREAILEHRGPEHKPGYSAELHHSLAMVGFRRSQDITYRPACDDCQECKSARIPVILFDASKSQKRTLNKNKDVTFELKPNIATSEQYELLIEYIEGRHSEGGMAGISYPEYQDMVQSSPISTIIIEYRQNNGKLIGVALSDQMKDSLSMVYSFFDISPEMNKRSLGVFIVLNHINIAESRDLDHVYLGYFVKNSPKMSYKMNFKPIEILSQSGWKLIK